MARGPCSQGIPFKTRHREVAPNQYEIAPFFGIASAQIDENLMLMQLIEEAAMLPSSPAETLRCIGPIFYTVFKWIMGRDGASSCGIVTRKLVKIMVPNGLKNVLNKVMPCAWHYTLPRLETQLKC